jgi:hypothetical protein
MGDTPTTVNKPAQSVANMINFAIYDVAVNVAEAAAISQVPFLGLPVIKQVFHFVLSKMAGLIYVPLATGSIFTVIKIQTDSQKKEYAEAEGKLRLANLSGDPEAIRKATDEFKKSFRRLVHYDGDAHA